MSLLTEKQIKEILLIIENEVNVEWPDTMLEMLCEWNEKQPSTQFEPDWDNAPCDATSVYLQSAWFDTHMKEIYRVTICGWGRPVTPHPHAAIMAKYAEVAARRVDPWMEFERYNHLTGSWDRLDDQPSWRPKARFRHIGDAK